MANDEEELEDDEEELDLVMFLGAINGAEPDLSKSMRLVQAGLVPSKKLITDAITRRAETIVVEPQGGAARVKLEVDGVAYPGTRLAKQNALAITQILKLLSGLDPKERKRPQLGGLKAEYQGNKYKIAIATEPIAGGAERLTIRSKGGTIKLENPEELGFSPELKQRISDIASERMGLLLACGPPGSGTTTTVQSGVLRSVDAYMYSIVTIADMNGREILNVTEFESEPDDSLSETLMRIIRSENDVAFVDPLRDAETLKTYCERSEEVTIIAEFAARDTASGIAQLVQWIGADMVCERIRGIVTQRLIRRLCEKCKFAYKPHPKLLAKIGLPEDTRVLYKPRPEPTGEEAEQEEIPVCRRCGGLHYFGRVGMFELLEVTDPVKQAIRAGADPVEIRKAARADGQRSLQQDGLRLVEKGTTSLEELQRIFRPPAKKGTKKKKRRPS